MSNSDAKLMADLEGDAVVRAGAPRHFVSGPVLPGFLTTKEIQSWLARIRIRREETYPLVLQPKETVRLVQEAASLAWDLERALKELLEYRRRT